MQVVVKQHNGILRKGKIDKRAPSIASTIPYSDDGSQRRTDSTVSYSSVSGQTDASKKSKSSSATMSSSTSKWSSSQRSTASTVPYALHDDPGEANDRIRMANAKIGTPSRNPDCIVEQGKVLSAAQQAFASREIAASAMKRAQTAPPSMNRARDPGIHHNEAGMRLLSTSHGIAKGEHDLLPSPASTQPYVAHHNTERPRAAHGTRRPDERRGVVFSGMRVAPGGEKVVKLARELWEFDSKHARLAKDLQKYMRGGKVEDPVSLAEYIQSKMSALDFEEAKKREREKARNEAEAERRQKQEEKREKEHNAAEEHNKACAQREIAKRVELQKRRDEVDKKESEAVARKRAAEMERTAKLRKELVDKEDERIKLVDETSRAREMKRRQHAADVQERENQELCDRDAQKRAEKVAREEKVRTEQERYDPQVIRAEAGNPSLMQGHSKMIAPYAMQQRPMLVNLSRWKHAADNRADYTTAKPLQNQEFRLAHEEIKRFMPQQGAMVGAHDRSWYVSRKWEVLT